MIMADTCTQVCIWDLAPKLFVAGNSWQYVLSYSPSTVFEGYLSRAHNIYLILCIHFSPRTSAGVGVS